MADEPEAPQPPAPLCQALIWLDKDGKANTYCMRNRGHDGEHSPEHEQREKGCK
jgi:hypothetical protein